MLAMTTAETECEESRGRRATGGWTRCQPADKWNAEDQLCAPLNRTTRCASDGKTFSAPPAVTRQLNCRQELYQPQLRERSISSTGNFLSSRSSSADLWLRLGTKLIALLKRLELFVSARLKFSEDATVSSYLIGSSIRALAD